MARARDVAARIEEIEAQAAAIRCEAAATLRDYGLSTALPWDIRVVAAMLTGGPVESRPNLANAAGERLAGLLEGTLDRASIFFEAYDPVVRQRFSVAHELGHFFLHAGGAVPGTVYGRCTQGRVDPAEVPDSPTTSHGALDEEAEADAFAAALLMPATELHADLARFGRGVPFLAARYVVSEAALRRRIATLRRLS